MTMQLSGVRTARERSGAKSRPDARAAAQGEQRGQQLRTVVADAHHCLHELGVWRVTGGRCGSLQHHNLRPGRTNGLSFKPPPAPRRFARRAPGAMPMPETESLSHFPMLDRRQNI